MGGQLVHSCCCALLSRAFERRPAAAVALTARDLRDVRVRLTSASVSSSIEGIRLRAMAAAAGFERWTTVAAGDDEMSSGGWGAQRAAAQWRRDVALSCSQRMSSSCSDRMQLMMLDPLRITHLYSSPCSCTVRASRIQVICRRIWRCWRVAGGLIPYVVKECNDDVGVLLTVIARIRAELQSSGEQLDPAVAPLRSAQPAESTSAISRLAPTTHFLSTKPLLAKQTVAREYYSSCCSKRRVGQWQCIVFRIGRKGQQGHSYDWDAMVK
jgi:hypothetical protein